MCNHSPGFTEPQGGEEDVLEKKRGGILASSNVLEKKRGGILASSNVLEKKRGGILALGAISSLQEEGGGVTATSNRSRFTPNVGKKRDLRDM